MFNVGKNTQKDRAEWQDEERGVVFVEKDSTPPGIKYPTTLILWGVKYVSLSGSVAKT
jgi:hypothetical protein